MNHTKPNINSMVHWVEQITAVATSISFYFNISHRLVWLSAINNHKRSHYYPNHLSNDTNSCFVSVIYKWNAVSGFALGKCIFSSLASKFLKLHFQLMIEICGHFWQSSVSSWLILSLILFSWTFSDATETSYMSWPLSAFHSVDNYFHFLKSAWKVIPSIFSQYYSIFCVNVVSQVRAPQPQLNLKELETLYGTITIQDPNGNSTLYNCSHRNH